MNNDGLIAIKENIRKKLDKISLKEIVTRLKNNHTESPMSTYIANKHNLQTENSTDNPFSTLRSTTKEVKLKNVQYKILHNIYPTQKHLFKWKLSDTPYCHYCKNEVETIMHAIHYCPIAMETKANLERHIKNEFDIDLVISPLETLFGIGNDTNYNLSNKQKSIINTLLIIIKRKLILQRENKLIISLNEIKNFAQFQMKLDSYISKTTKIDYFK
jgi:hypothetical protein